MEKFKKIKIASILGLVGNIFLLIIKGIVGLLTNSQAMLADAVNSATDIFSSLMTFIGNKIASSPSDEDHNLGHGKAEYIYSNIISITMFFLCLIIFKDSLISFFKPNEYNYSFWLIIICITTIVTKFSLYLYTNHVSKSCHNLLLKANAKDHRNDCILTTFNLLSAVLANQGIIFFDSITGIGISIWISFTAWQIFKESYDVLMDKSISSDVKEEILKIISNHHEIEKVIHFNSTPVGYLYQISFTIYVDGNLSTFQSHEIANNLEKEINEKIDKVYLTVIHVNPIEIKEPKNP